MSEARTEQLDDATLAVETAKTYFRKVFAGEPIENLALEEVKPPQHGTVWQVTLGFDRSRPRRPSTADIVTAPNAFLQAAAAAAARPQRVYKIVQVDVSIPRALDILNWKED